MHRSTTSTSAPLRKLVRWLYCGHPLAADTPDDPVLDRSLHASSTKPTQLQKTPSTNPQSSPTHPNCTTIPIATSSTTMILCNFPGPIAIGLFHVGHILFMIFFRYFAPMQDADGFMMLGAISPIKLSVWDYNLLFLTYLFLSSIKLISATVLSPSTSWSLSIWDPLANLNLVLFAAKKTDTKPVLYQPR